MVDKYSFETEIKFTKVYKKHYNDHPAIREAHCLDVQYPAFFTPFKENDLFAGRIKPMFIGITPDEWGPTAFGYYCQFAALEKELSKDTYDTSEKAEISKLLDFWQKESTSARLRNAYTQKMSRYLPSDDWMHASGIAFPLYRLTGGNVNFKKLLQLGLPGMKKLITGYEARAAKKGADVSLFKAMRMALDTFDRVIEYYRIIADEKFSGAKTFGEKQHWAAIIETLESNKKQAPQTFREALQLFWLYSLISDIRNYGRMDVCFGDILTEDIENKKISEQEAQKLLESMWQLMADRNTVVHGRVIIGGKGRPNPENADRFALMALEASLNVHEIEPQLSLRIFKGMNPALYEKGLDVIAAGRTYPIIYNDDVNIPAVQCAFAFQEQEAEQYVPYGCGEYILEHRSFGTPSGVINLLKALEVTLNNGRDPLTNKITGLQSGEFKDFTTFDDLYRAYKKQVEFFVEMLAEQEVLEYEVAGEHAAFLYMSMLYDDCLEKGKAIFSGGIRYLGGTLETYGNSNTADSLLAIKKLVYEKEDVSKSELLSALNNDFKGHDFLRKKLLALPKYGNDDEDADCMLVNIHDHVCTFTRDQAARVGLHSYLVVIINNSANTLMGHQTGASADGRKAGKPMNNGNAPSGGADHEGVTAMLNSVVKPDTHIHAGAVQNMKFSRDLFMNHRHQLKTLLKTYFDNGGAQAMITVVDRGELEKAMEHPELYGHIFVRVGGFSARFVELSRDVQLDILSRTLY